MISQLLGFRPLDGESISKHYCDELDIDPDTSESFRPLDGESISKLVLHRYPGGWWGRSFRPLDGESISKLLPV